MLQELPNFLKITLNHKIMSNHNIVIALKVLKLECVYKVEIPKHVY